MSYLVTSVLTTAAVVASCLSSFLQVQPGQWTPRSRIPGTNDLADITYLVADQNRTVYAFFTQPIAEGQQEQAIFYNTWTAADGWGTAVDIILPPLPFGWMADIMGAFLDHSGTIHVIYNGGTARSSDIYYTSAPARSAGQARSWSEPKIVGPGVSLATMDSAALAGDNQGNLFVVYVGGSEGIGVYGIRSPDGGNTWSDPTRIFLTSDSKSMLSTVQSQMDQQGRLHVVWLVNDSNGRGQSITYARLEADHETWSDPALLAQVGQYDYRLLDGVIGSRVEWPAVVAHDDELMVFYTACEPCERRMRRSTDAGQSWTDPIEPFRTRGSYGGPTFAVDSSNTLHMVLTDRARHNDLWHSEWRDGRWQEPESLTPISASPGMSASSYDPFWPKAIISQGNVLLVSWSQDPGVQQTGISYAYKILDTPEEPTIPLATATPTATPTPTPAALSETPAPILPTTSPRPIVDPPSAPNVFGHGAGFLIAGLGPTVLLIAALVAGRFLVRRHHRRSGSWSYDK